MKPILLVSLLSLTACASDAPEVAPLAGQWPEQTSECGQSGPSGCASCIVPTSITCH